MSEALWKRRPVIGGKAGGITLQVLDGVSGYLVESIEECAERAAELLADPAKADEMGERTPARAGALPHYEGSRRLSSALREHAGPLPFTRATAGPPTHPMARPMTSWPSSGGR